MKVCAYRLIHQYEKHNRFALNVVTCLFPSSHDIKPSPPLCPLCSTRPRQREEGAPAENQSFSSSTRNALNEMTAS